MYHDLIESVAVQQARLRWIRHKPDLVVRMHPLDEMYLRGYIRADLPLARFMDMPVEIDPLEQPGAPVVAYAPIDITSRLPGDNVVTLRELAP